MAAKKNPNRPTRSKPSKKSGVMATSEQAVEASYTDGTGKTQPIDPGRVAADLALGRLKVVEKFAIIVVDGEYQGQLKYRAK